MNKTRRRRQRRAAHATRAQERNLARGYTSGDLAKLNTTDATANEKTIEAAKSKSNVGRHTPSYHKPGYNHTPDTRDFERPGHPAWNVMVSTTTAPTQEDWDEVVAQAKRRKRSIKTFAKKKGWVLVDGADPKQRESWYMT